MNAAKPPLWAMPVVHKLVTTTPAMTALDERVEAQRERLDRVSPETWGTWFDTARRYGASSGPWRGALLELVRETWGVPEIGISAVTVWTYPQGTEGRGVATTWWRIDGLGLSDMNAMWPSEGEALISALEQAPR